MTRDRSILVRATLRLGPQECAKGGATLAGNPAENIDELVPCFQVQQCRREMKLGSRDVVLPQWETELLFAR